MNSSKAPTVASEKLRKSQSQRHQELRDQKMLLEKKSELQGLKSLAKGKTAQFTFTPADLQLSKMSETQLYSELLHRYQLGDELSYRKAFNVMSRRFPKSTLMDESLYMMGLLSVSSKDYGAALQSFNQILSQNASSNRAVSAMFAKAAVYKKMNLPDLAEEVFRSVQLKYPGSPEALRAQNELKILK